MATHNLFDGGNRRVVTFPVTFYPSCDVLPDQNFEPDNRGSPVVFSLNKRLHWNAFPDQCDCTDIGVAAAGMAEYLENTPIVVGDIINVNILPIESSLERVWIKVNKACAGFTFDLVVRGNAESLGGTPLAPVPMVVASGIDAGVTGSDLIVLPAPVYLNQNDMLELHITGLGPDGIGCSDVIISPVVHTYCRVGQ